MVLAGNPNCGKTTLFNVLTGSRQTVGNWPGVTVEKKTGEIFWNGLKLQVTDLPGIYSLSPYTPEERLARSFLADNRENILIDVADASHIERSLYLTTQFLELGVPVVVALNMMDAAEERGINIRVRTLAQLLGVPVIPITASKGEGTKALLDAAVKMRGQVPKGIVQLPAPSVPDREARTAQARYQMVEALVAGCVTRRPAAGADISERIDAVLTHRAAAVPLFFLIVLAVFFLTFGPLGAFLGQCMEYILGFLTQLVSRAFYEEGVAPLVTSLAVDGILAGVGSVLRFAPQILILFFCLSILEDSGYMARAAFIMDAPMRRLGLSGRAFVPLLMGFGCTVPAVLGTRILESEKDKRLTILVTPFFSCSAKMPVYMLLAGVFFSKRRAWVLLILYLFGVLFAALSALLFKNTILRGEPESFVMELPDYRFPTPHSLWLHVWQRLKDFLLRAGSVILIASVLVWFLQSFSPALQPVQDSSLSILALLGKAICPVFVLCGFGSWQASVALVTGLVAKESVAGTLGILCSGAAQGLPGIFTPLSAFSFLLFVLLYPPCVAAFSTIQREMGSLKWAAAAAGWQLLSAWFVSALFYQISLLVMKMVT